MSAFGGVKLTNKGLALISKAQTGVPINFTKIAMGSGAMSGGQTIPTMTALIDLKKNLSISKLKVLQPGEAVVGGSFSNSDITTGFTFRELGLFAQDPDDGEILFSYGNAGVNGEYIPPGSGGSPDIIERHIDIIAVAGSAATLTATINSSLVYVSVQDFEDGLATKVDKESGKGLSTNDYTTPEKSKLAGIAAGAQVNAVTTVAGKTGAVTLAKGDVGLGNVDNVQQAPISHVGAGGSAHAEASTSAAGFMSAADKQLSANRDGYGTTGGTTTAYTVSLSPAPTLSAGLTLRVKLNVANGNNPTINVNALGAKSILKANGLAPAAGSLKLNGVYTLTYDGTAFILQGEGGEYGTATAAQVLAPNTIGTENGVIAGTMVNRTAGGDVPGTSAAAEHSGRMFIQPPQGYYNGAQAVYSDDPHFVPANIRKDIDVFGMVGTMEPNVPPLQTTLRSKAVGSWAVNAGTPVTISSTGNLVPAGVGDIGRGVFANTPGGALATNNLQAGATDIHFYSDTRYLQIYYSETTSQLRAILVNYNLGNMATVGNTLVLETSAFTTGGTYAQYRSAHLQRIPGDLNRFILVYGAMNANSSNTYVMYARIISIDPTTSTISTGIRYNIANLWEADKSAKVCMVTASKGFIYYLDRTSQSLMKQEIQVSSLNISQIGSASVIESQPGVGIDVANDSGASGYIFLHFTYAAGGGTYASRVYAISASTGGAISSQINVTSYGPGGYGPYMAMAVTGGYIICSYTNSSGDTLTYVYTFNGAAFTSIGAGPMYALHVTAMIPASASGYVYLIGRQQGTQYLMMHLWNFNEYHNITSYPRQILSVVLSSDQSVLHHARAALSPNGKQVAIAYGRWTGTLQPKGLSFDIQTSIHGIAAEAGAPGAAILYHHFN